MKYIFNQIKPTSEHIPNFKSKVLLLSFSEYSKFKVLVSIIYPFIWYFSIEKIFLSNYETHYIFLFDCD